jgi:hypothetical protein
MAQAGYTPISLYHSTTATTVPSASNLTAGEVALNIADNDMSMYMENASGTVKLFFNNPGALKYPTADGTNGQPIVTNGSATLSFGTVGVGGGGTGQTSLTLNNVILGNGTSAVQFVAPGASGNILTSDGTTWTSSAPAASGVSKGQSIAFALIFGM